MCLSLSCPSSPLPPPPQAEYCAKGSLTELLAEGREDAAAAAELTWRRRLSMVRCSSASAEQPADHCCASAGLKKRQCWVQGSRRQSLLTRPDLTNPSAHPAWNTGHPMQALNAALGMLHLHNLPSPIVHRDLVRHTEDPNRCYFGNSSCLRLWGRLGCL